MRAVISNTKLKKGDHYYIQTRHEDLFSHYNRILRKLSEKISRKALENTNEMKQNVLMPPGHPIIQPIGINSIWPPYR